MVELRRKSIHYVGLTVPFLYYFVFDRPSMLAFTGAALAAFLAIDYLRLKKSIPLLNRFFDEQTHVVPVRVRASPLTRTEREIRIPAFGNIMRTEERRGLGAHTFFAAGAFLCILLYQKNIAVAAVAILVVGDSAAAIVGKAVGRHRIYRKKTLEGYAACLVASCAICLMLLPPFVSVAGALGAATTELFSRLNDNLSIPVISGAVMTAAGHLF